MFKSCIISVVACHRKGGSDIVSNLKGSRIDNNHLESNVSFIPVVNNKINFFRNNTSLTKSNCLNLIGLVENSVISILNFNSHSERASIQRGNVICLEVISLSKSHCNRGRFKGSSILVKIISGMIGIGITGGVNYSIICSSESNFWSSNSSNPQFNTLVS